MKIYKCNRALELPTFDEDGRETDEWMFVPDGTIWHTPQGDSSYRFIGGEVRLENEVFGWIEIASQTLSECFTEIILMSEPQKGRED